jgi:hypothetical protein
MNISKLQEILVEIKIVEIKVEKKEIRVLIKKIKAKINIQYIKHLLNNKVENAQDQIIDNFIDFNLKYYVNFILPITLIFKY